MNTKQDTATILVVDDEVSIRNFLNRLLTEAGFTVIKACDVQHAIRFLGSTDVDVVLTDITLPDLSGFELARHVKENSRYTEVIVISGASSIDNAVTSIKLGAEEFLSKPFDTEKVINSVCRALAKVRKKKAASESESEQPFKGLIGSSTRMADVYARIRKAAGTDATVLVTGESGTGKELVSRAIHYSSSRAKGPFIAINCGAIPENLLESELFGHRKGAFSGAVSSRQGFFKSAETGTIFLDEISDTSIDMQQKLLRVLQSKEITTVGSSKTEKVDVRVIAACNQDLNSLVAKKCFRDDLFYRLNVFSINLSPLRDRKSDIPVLSAHFAEKYRDESGGRTLEITDPVMQAFTEYSWPGNVRELENLILNLSIMSETGKAEISDLPEHFRFSLSFSSQEMITLAEVEKRHILYVLNKTDNNKSQAAKILGIGRKTLIEKLKRFNS